MGSKEEDNQDVDIRHKSGHECCKLSYLEENQIHIRRIRKHRLTCSKEVGTTISLHRLLPPPSREELFTSSAEHETTSTGSLIPLAEVGTGSGMLEAFLESDVKSCSDEEAEEGDARSRIEDVEIDNDNNNPVILDIAQKVKLTSPTKLKPIFLGEEDVRTLLEVAREKCQSVGPKWQREGITRINQFLINLEPFSKPLFKIEQLLGSKIENSKGGQVRLLFFHFWFVGLIVESLQPEDDLHEIGYLIHQLRTPIRRLYQINTEVNDFMEESIKKFRHRILHLVNELDKPVYSDLLRLTPSLTPTNEDKGMLETEFEADLSQNIYLKSPGRSTLCITSISTVLLISCKDLKTEKVGQLTTKGKTYVIQGILSVTQKILTAIHDYAKCLIDLFHSKSAKPLKQSAKDLVRQLKKMRQENGLRHINASRNFSNSVKLLESELVRTGRMIEKVEIGTKWILEALEVCLRHGVTWTPPPHHHELSASEHRSRRSRLKKWFRLRKRKESIETTFHEFFGTENFLDVFNSFQILVPITKNRMKILFPRTEFESDFEEEVPPDPSTSSTVDLMGLEAKETPSDTTTEECCPVHQIL